MGAVPGLGADIIRQKFTFPSGGLPVARTRLAARHTGPSLPPSGESPSEEKQKGVALLEEESWLRCSTLWREGVFEASFRRFGIQDQSFSELQTSEVFPLRRRVLVVSKHLAELIKIQNLAAPFKDSNSVGLV